MPFSNLDKAWSDLAQYYNTVTNDGAFANPNNVTYTQKPQQPKSSQQFKMFDDGFIRGGVLNAFLSSKNDFTRIGNFLKSPKGVLWIAKQVGLQLSNPLLETKAKVNVTLDNNVPSLDKKKEPITYAGNGLIPTRIYNLGINTLAQVPLNATGIHIIRHGLLPTPAGAGYNYEKITKENNRLSAQTSTNTLNQSYKYGSKFGIAPAKSTSVGSLPPLPPPGQSYNDGTTTFYNNKNDNFYIPRNNNEVVIYASPDDAKKGIISKAASSIFSNTNSLDEVVVKPVASLKPTESVYTLLPNRLIQNLNKIILGDVTLKNGSNSVVLSYKFGGPQSVYGLGFTTISTAPDQRTNVTANEADPKRKLLNGFTPIGYNNLGVLSFNSTQYNSELSYINPGKSISSTDGDTNNIEITYGVSHNGNKNNLSSTRKIDSINVINVVDSTTFYSTLNNTFSNTSADVFTNKAITSSLNGKIDGKFSQDIIPFRIEFLNNTNPSTTDVLAFRAYINDFNDGMQAKWNGYRYMGRGEEFYIYEGFTRDIGVDFTIYTHSPEEMQPIYRKLNYLMSSFTPDYSDANKMRGNIGYLTIGDYIFRQPGVFTDIKLSGMLDTHWEIGNGGFSTNGLPKYIKVNLSFKPIHTFLPRKENSSRSIKAPFVGNTVLD